MSQEPKTKSKAEKRAELQMLALLIAVVLGAGYVCYSSFTTTVYMKVMTSLKSPAGGGSSYPIVEPYTPAARRAGNSR